MDTAQKKLPSFRKNRFLSPISPSLPLKGAAVCTDKRESLKPVWMKSPAIARTTREAGFTLYEILGMAELMRVAYEKGEMESMQNRLALLISEAANLSTILNNILELSELITEEATTTYQSFDIVALLREVSLTARLNMGQKPITIMDVSSVSPVTILSDPKKVYKIMMGLISHAVKFTDKGRIALILNKDEYRIRITITDTGRGMTAEQMNAAFAPSHTRGDTAKNGHATSGLRIVRNLVKLLEGSITVSSKVGEGTIFEVSLPLEPSENLKNSCRWTGKEMPPSCDGQR